MMLDYDEKSNMITIYRMTAPLLIGCRPDLGGILI